MSPRANASADVAFAGAGNNSANSAAPAIAMPGNNSAPAAAGNNSALPAAAREGPNAAAGFSTEAGGRAGASTAAASGGTSASGLSQAFAMPTLAAEGIAPKQATLSRVDGISAGRSQRRAMPLASPFASSPRDAGGGASG